MDHRMTDNDDGYRRLAIAVVTGAVKDLQVPKHQFKARQFLLHELWGSVWGAWVKPILSVGAVKRTVERSCATWDRPVSHVPFARSDTAIPDHYDEFRATLRHLPNIESQHPFRRKGGRPRA